MMQIRRIKENVIHIFRFIYEIDRSTFFSLSIAIILSGLVALPSLFLPKLIIDEFVSGRNYQNVIRYALIYAGLTMALNVSNQFIISKLEKQTKTLEYEGIIRLFKKIADIDYYMLQNADIMDNFAKATKCVMAQNFYLLNTSLVKFFSSVWLLTVTTGTLIFLDPKILLIVGVVIVINACTNSRMNKLCYQANNELWPLDRRMTWFMRFAGDLKYAKDVRSNCAQEFLFSKYRKLSRDFYLLQNKLVDSDRNVKLVNLPSTFRAGAQKRCRLAQTEDFVIEFLNVSYRYPNQDRDAARKIGLLHFMESAPKQCNYSGRTHCSAGPPGGI